MSKTARQRSPSGDGPIIAGKLRAHIESDCRLLGTEILREIAIFRIHDLSGVGFQHFAKHLARLTCIDCYDHVLLRHEYETITAALLLLVKNNVDLAFVEQKTADSAPFIAIYYHLPDNSGAWLDTYFEDPAFGVEHHHKNFLSLSNLGTCLHDFAEEVACARAMTVLVSKLLTLKTGFEVTSPPKPALGWICQDSFYINGFSKTDARGYTRSFTCNSTGYQKLRAAYEYEKTQLIIQKVGEFLVNKGIGRAEIAENSFYVKIFGDDSSTTYYNFNLSTCRRFLSDLLMHDFTQALKYAKSLPPGGAEAESRAVDVISAGLEAIATEFDLTLGSTQDLKI